jgi:hypothetical protein
MKKNCFYICIFVILLTGCAMRPGTAPVQVEVQRGVFVNLPKPAELGQTLNVSQLITAQWGEEKQQKLLVQLQVEPQQVVLAGFSAWGTRILSLGYSGEEIQTYLLNGLADTLPKPEQVLFHVMLSIWPVEAWQKSLAEIGWVLVDSDLQRKLIDDKGLVVIDITYQRKPYIDGTILFKHNTLDYVITIETNKTDTDR